MITLDNGKGLWDLMELVDELSESDGYDAAIDEVHQYIEAHAYEFLKEGYMSGDAEAVDFMREIIGYGAEDGHDSDEDDYGVHEPHRDRWTTEDGEFDNLAWLDMSHPCTAWDVVEDTARQLASFRHFSQASSDAFSFRVMGRCEALSIMCHDRWSALQWMEFIRGFAADNYTADGYRVEYDDDGEMILRDEDGNIHRKMVGEA